MMRVYVVYYDEVQPGFDEWREARIIEGVYATAEAASRACATVNKKKYVSYADFDIFEVQNEKFCIV